MRNSNWRPISVGWGTVFTARRYASTVYAVIVCPSVRPSVCLSQVGVLQRRLNLGSRKQRQFIDAKDLGEIPTGSLPTGASNRRGVG